LERERRRRGSDAFGGANGVVYVGPYFVARLFDDRSDLTAVLRDDAVTLKEDAPSGPEVVISMPGRQVAERLDELGVDKPAARAAFDEQVSRRNAELGDGHPADGEHDPVRPELSQRQAWVRREERDALIGLDLETWITRTRAAAVAAEPLDSIMVRPEPDNFWWLFDLVTRDGRLDDVVMMLRLILLVFPDERVIVWLRADTAASAVLPVRSPKPHNMSDLQHSATYGAVALILFTLLKAYASANFSLTTAAALLSTAPLRSFLERWRRTATKFFR
jgi:hypothetical protein